MCNVHVLTVHLIKLTFNGYMTSMGTDSLQAYGRKLMLHTRMHIIYTGKAMGVHKAKNVQA